MIENFATYLEIRALKKKERELISSKVNNPEDLKLEIKVGWERIQKKCNHVMVPVMRRNQNYSNGTKESIPVIFAGWKCKKCRLFIPRPEKTPWELCYICGGEMHRCYWSNPRLQIRTGRLYRCTCGHLYVRGPTEI